MPPPDKIGPWRGYYCVCGWSGIGDFERVRHLRETGHEPTMAEMRSFETLDRFAERLATTVERPS